MSESTNNSRGTSSFVYGGSPILAPSSSVYGPGRPASTGLQYLHQSTTTTDCYDRSHHPTVKTEAGASQNHTPSFYYPPNNSSGFRSTTSHQESNEVDALKAKIIAHPHYSNLLEAYMDCQKVGAPAEVVARLTAVRREFEARQRSSTGGSSRDHVDPELDQFMEAYYDMLVKYREELTRPLQEAMDFMRRIETQLNMLTSNNNNNNNNINNNGAPALRIFSNSAEDKCEGVGSSEEDQENSGGETDQLPEIDPRAEDRELKNHLLKKYSGYLGSLKQELSKKKKKGKLPKDARQKLLSWWELHYKWPYPSESEKVALAESTGLDQKQINNWFINQRKRHWKPSEDMQFMVMDGNVMHPQNLYMEGHYMGEGPYRLGP
ncbi:hypothetical protein RD792_011301 [Penstemon davidsonii]|uniref:Uncharacterized protein n=1 Tax=Penstemon davidsonii TaxID=160366 RepID=A0ABR0D481_9LAMI|nr:hypothetical protein RD792_011301 [Penstemon davidsonii]